MAGFPFFPGDARTAGMNFLPSPETTRMKNTNKGLSKPKTSTSHKDRQPDVRDDLDSRKNEEFDIKGDDITHNKKETKEGKKKYGGDSGKD